ncbi:MAG: UDP-N-acetylglucosamine 2-epimerase [Flavobacteriaceae bacterium]|nr:UDP-N-acetylglucosamine 2-epimerase [Flavobacteriaceae bacterium]
MHLSPEFGLTYKEIEKDGLKIDEKIEILLSSDTNIGVSKSMGLALISFAEAYKRLKPNLLIGLGDRFELCKTIKN